MLEAAEARIPDCSTMTLPSRVVHLPMAFDERWTHEAIAKYMKSVRPSAPYLPDNIAYIADNNGLSGGKDEVGGCVGAWVWRMVCGARAQGERVGRVEPSAGGRTGGRV